MALAGKAVLAAPLGAVDQINLVVPKLLLEYQFWLLTCAEWVAS